MSVILRLGEIKGGKQGKSEIQGQKEKGKS